MRYGALERTQTIQPRHTRVRLAIEKRCGILRQLGYKFDHNHELKTLAGLVDGVRAFDQQERLLLAQLSSESIRFAKQTVLELV